MALIARPIPPGTRGFDTVETITPAIAQAAKAQGNGFVIRYGTAVQSSEVDAVTSTGQGLGFVSFGRRADFNLTTGAQDSEAILDHLRSVGVPVGSSLTLGADLETPSGATVQDVLAYEKGFATRTTSTTCTSGPYVGAGLSMTSAELYSMAGTRYWKSGSRIVDADGHAADPECGWAMIQAYPFNQKCGGAQVDFDFAQQDFMGRSWWAIYAVPSGAAFSIPKPSTAHVTTEPPPPTDPDATIEPGG
jgi:hypothetical protein